MKLTESDILYMPNYVFCCWLNETRTQNYYAIYRDLTDNNKVDYVLTQLAGPWRKYDKATDSLVFDSAHDEVYLEVQKKAEIVLDQLNRGKEVEWSGRVHKRG